MPEPRSLTDESDEEVAQYQHNLANRIGALLSAEPVPEWDISHGSTDHLDPHSYCPRLDIAFGPCNINTRVAENVDRISAKYNANSEFWNHLTARATFTPLQLGTNQNPRCLLAIEIENTTSAKHQLGSMFNADAIAKVGVIVGWNHQAMASLRRIREYLEFLILVGKIPTRLFNAIVIDRQTLASILDSLEDTRRT